MKEDLQIVKPEKKSLIPMMAAKFDLDPLVFQETIKKTCFPSGQVVTNEQLIAFLSIANQYNLNPFTREIFAFVTKGGGIQPVVSIDGWMNLINSHPQFDGLEFVPEYTGADAQLYAMTCKIYRKDRTHPMVITEYLDECFRPTDPWKQMKKRMLRHKSAIQCSRYAFGFAGIQDEDEARDAINAEVGPALVTAAATETKTEVLKEKIAKAKNARVQEAVNAPAPPQETRDVPSSEPTALRTEVAAGAPSEEDKTLFSEPTQPQKPVEDRTISREEQIGLVDVLTAKKATRSLVLAKLKEKGYERTQDLKLSDLPYFLNWAQSLPEPKSA